MPRHTILFLAAAPGESGQLALHREVRAIQTELERTGYRDRFVLEARWAVEPLDLLRELRKLKPTVVHFSGLGAWSAPGTPQARPDPQLGRALEREPEGGLFFQSPEGRSQLVSARAVEQTFGAAGGSVRLVVLSACYSESQAEALLAHVDCVVGWSGSLEGDAARCFAIGFYGGLGEQESLEVAYQQGPAAIGLEGLLDGDPPQLRVRPGVDAGRLVLAGTAQARLGASMPDRQHERGPSHRPFDDPAIARPRPRAPAPHDIFVGRDAELARIGAAFDEPGAKRVAVVAIQGMAGVGKTYLAHELYARHAGRFGSYQHLVLDPERPGTVATWMAALGEKAGIETPQQIDAATVVEALIAQRALVHVDNVDSTAAAELVAALSRALESVPMLVTGRYTELGTAAGSGWLRIELMPLEPSPALDLLRAELAGITAAVPERELTELVRQVAGLPLALHLAAGHLRRGRTVERFLGRLRDEGFALGPRDPADHVLADRARGVLATSFAISRELLLAEAGSEAAPWRAALEGLGWAPRAGFGRSLGAALTGLDGARGAFEDFIEAAVALSLVRRLRLEERASPAWSVHPLLGEFLRAGTDRAEIDGRIATWTELRANNEAPARAARWDELSAETAALGEWLGVASDAIVRELLPRTWEFATSRGPIGPWLAAAHRVRRRETTRGVLWALCQLASRAGEIETVVDAATEMAHLAEGANDDHDRALALGQIADTRAACGELDEALRIRREEVLPLVERLGDERDRAIAMGQIADVMAAGGELDEAVEIWREEVLPVVERLGDVRSRAITMGQIADVRAARGELDEAMQIWREEVLPALERLGDARERAITLDQIADVLSARGDRDEALRIRREEVLPAFEQLGDVRSRAITLGKVSDALAARGELEDALRIWCQEELPVYERLGDVRERAITLGKIADVMAARGELDEALRIRREQILPIVERLGDARARAFTLSRIADVLTARGELDEALRIWRDEVAPSIARLGDVRACAITLGKIAEALAARGAVEEALRVRCEGELPLYQQLGDERSRAITLVKIANLLATRGEHDQALRIWRDSLAVFKQLGDARSRAITHGKIADVLAAHGELDQALRIRREEELPVYEQLGDLRSRAITLGQIADVLAARGERVEALALWREALHCLARLSEPALIAAARQQIARLESGSE